MPPPMGRSNQRSNSGVAVYDDEFRGYRLFIGNIAPGVTEHDVCKYFGYFGEVKMVWLARDPPGFAYVVYFDRDVAETARHKTHMCRWFNRLIKVEFAVPRGRNPRRTNNSFNSRRSRSQDNSHRFRSRGVRINRSRSPVNGARRSGSRRYSDSQHSDARNGGRGMLPPPPRSNNDDRRDRQADNGDHRRYESSRSRINSDRHNDDDSRRDYDSAGRSRYSDNDSGHLKRSRNQTSVEEDDGSTRRLSTSDNNGNGDKRRRNYTEDEPRNGSRNLTPSKPSNRNRAEEKTSGGKAVLDRSPGELIDRDDVADNRRNADDTRGRKKRDTLSPPVPRNKSGVSRSTTRYRSSPDVSSNRDAGVKAGRRYAADDDKRIETKTDEKQNGAPAEHLTSPETARRYYSRSNSVDDHEFREQLRSSHSRQQQLHSSQAQNADYEEFDEDDSSDRIERASSGDLNDRQRGDSNNNRTNGDRHTASAGKPAKQRNISPSAGIDGYELVDES